MRPQIIQWALIQRQQAEISGLTLYQTQQTFPGISATYVRVNGSREELELVLSPVPPVKGEDERCLLVLHDTNKATAISMQELEVDEVQTLSAKLSRTLTTSNWGTELLKAAQYLLDKDDGGIAMSPVKIANNVVTRSETHCFVSVKAKFETFFDTSTLARRTPHVNGGNKRYYTANDQFEFNSSGLRYVGGYGEGDTPIAITAEGSYYYKFSISAYVFVATSSEPQELRQLDGLDTDAVIEAEITATEASYPSVVTGLGYRALYLSNADQNTLYSSIYPLTSNGDAGYGVYSAGTYTATYKLATTGTASAGFPAIATDISTSLPMSVFSQQDGVDLLMVELVPVTASMAYANFAATLTINVQFLHVSYSMVKAPGPFPTTPAANPYDPAFASFPMYRVWALTFPPSLSTQSGEYYFADAGKIRTPYGNYDYSFVAPHNTHQYIMRDAYIPWFHLSNGKTCLQAFEVNNVRHVYCKSTEVTEMLATACGTDISNIQGCLIDFPLAKIRDLT